jgi:hypothetical protein
MAFHLSDKGKQWMSNVKFGPFVNPNFLLNGEPYRKPQEGSETDNTGRADRGNSTTGRADRGNSTCEYTQLLLNSITENDMNSLTDKITNTDFLTVYISLPTFQTDQKPEEEGGGGDRDKQKAYKANKQNKPWQR